MNLKKKAAMLCTGILMVCALAGCGGSEAQKPFTIVYAPNESTEQSADARNGMAKDLSKVLGVEVKEIQASDYNAIIEALRTKKADMAYLGPEGIAMGYERAKIEPIAMKAIDGDRVKAVYHSVFITKSARTDIQSLKDLRGKKMAFVDPGSTSGNLIPTGELMKAFSSEGLTSEDLHTNGKFFETAIFSGKHQASIQAIAKGDVDAAAVSDQILASEIRTGNLKKDEIKIIGESGPIPAEGIIVRQDMPQELKDKLQGFLVGYDNKEYFKKVIKVENARFITSTIEDYQTIIDLNKLIHK